MGIFSTIIFGILFITIAVILIVALKGRGGRSQLKKDFGLSDNEIDEKFGTSTVEEKDLESLENEKRKKAG